ncbi:trypsin-4-like [Hermetia illucens]|uniref:trypsin-4-like n=1 Tax=Hermetia illucens TaxID=343691 RepID=UPI0018CBFDDC|nr:trypsin-4-like [Hermetia illucens]
MFRTVVFLLVLGAVWASLPPFQSFDHGTDGKIVGGQATDISKFPHQVSLRSGDFHFCGGSIYRTNIIITAAHCFYGLPWPNLNVVSGASKKSEGGLSTAVKEIVLHPYFDDEIMDYDVAILLLEEGIPFDDTRQPIALPAANSKTVDGSRAYVSGWGATLEGGSSPDQLQYVAVMTMDRQKCAEAYQKVDYPVTERMICAGEETGGKDACQGDSGGPLVLQNKLIGIVSWGVGCARSEYPGVYSNVAILRQWIDQTVEKLTSGTNV